MIARAETIEGIYYRKSFFGIPKSRDFLEERLCNIKFVTIEIGE